MVKINKKCC